MRRLAALAVALVTFAALPSTASAYYVEYYRDNLFLGLAYHRVGCLTDWTTIQSTQEYDGFTTFDYCTAGTSSNSVPSGEWFDWNYVAGSTLSAAKSSLDNVGNQANTCYATPNYAARSNVCSYNVLMDCNSDCWMENFSSRQGWTVDTASGCWGAPPVASVNGISCDK
ncbi:MAG: hypothetical protein R3B06_01445 [Kofleriaceae bacterium]